MNFRQRLLRLCTIGCGLLLILSLGLAPRAALAVIDPKIKTSLDAAKSRDAIAASVKERVADLAGADPAKRSAARDGLITEINLPNVSTEFLDTYAQELNNQLKPLVDPTQPDVKIRLNAAIVVAKVAEKSNTARFAEITDILLKDKSDAVVNWGLKASRYVLPPVLAAGLPQAKALIKSIRAKVGDPVLLPLVYDALSIDFQNNRQSPQFPKMVAGAVPEMIAVLRERVDLICKQVPPDATVDVAGMNFLVATSVWKQQTPPQQLETAQLLSDYIGVAGQRGAMSTGTDREQMTKAVQNASNAIGATFVIAGQPIPPAIQQLMKLDPNNPSYAQMVGAAYPALKAVTAWKDLKAPPKCEGANPATAPAAGAPAAPPPAAK